MDVHGEYTPYLSSWVEDRLGCHRLTMDLKWTGGRVPRIPPDPPISIPHVRSEHNPDEGGGSGTTRYFFEGVDGDAPNRVTYEFLGSFNQEPLTSHPKIGSLLQKYRGRLEDGEIIWDEKDPTGQSKRRGINVRGEKVDGINPMYGQTAYLAFGAIWAVTRLYNANSIPPSILRGIGTIFNAVPGDPPTPSGRNWLKMSPTGRVRGNVMEIADNYMLSGIGGWSKPVYDGSDIEGETGA